MAQDSPVDRLLAESRRLREELLRTANRLEIFSEDLMTEVRALREEAGPVLNGNGGDDDQGTGARPDNQAD